MQIYYCELLSLLKLFRSWSENMFYQWFYWREIDQWDFYGTWTESGRYQQCMASWKLLANRTQGLSHVNHKYGLYRIPYVLIWYDACRWHTGGAFVFCAGVIARLNLSQFPPMLMHVGKWPTAKLATKRLVETERRRHHKSKTGPSKGDVSAKIFFLKFKVWLGCIEIVTDPSDLLILQRVLLGHVTQ